MPSIIYTTEKEDIDYLKLKLHGLVNDDYKIYPENIEEKWGKELLNHIIKISSLNQNISVILRNTDQLWRLKIYDKLLKTLEENETITFISIVKNLAAVPKTIRSRSIVIIDKSTKTHFNESPLTEINQDNLHNYNFKDLRVITKIIEKYDNNMRYNLPLSENISIPLDIINERSY